MKTDPETKLETKPESKAAAKAVIPDKNLLTYDCFLIEEIGDELHCHTEGGRFVRTKKADANVIKKGEGQKYDRIQVDRTTAEIR